MTTPIPTALDFTSTLDEVGTCSDCTLVDRDGKDQPSVTLTEEKTTAIAQPPIRPRRVRLMRVINVLMRLL
jgi:hypothetical protein